MTDKFDPTQYSDDEAAEILQAHEEATRRIQARRQEAAQAELMQAYQAQAAKIQATGINKVKKLADLKRKFRQAGLDIW
jgi:hypothetical protein